MQPAILQNVPGRGSKYELKAAGRRRTFDVGRRAQEWPDTVYVSVNPTPEADGAKVLFIDADGEILEEDDCKCFSTDCSVNSLGCAITCFIFPIVLTCPRCFYCAIFGG